MIQIYVCNNQTGLLVYKGIISGMMISEQVAKVKLWYGLDNVTEQVCGHMSIYENDDYTMEVIKL